MQKIDKNAKILKRFDKFYEKRMKKEQGRRKNKEERKKRKEKEERKKREERRRRKKEKERPGKQKEKPQAFSKRPLNLRALGEKLILK